MQYFYDLHIFHSYYDNFLISFFIYNLVKCNNLYKDITWEY